MYQTVICLDLPSPAGSSDLPGQCGSKDPPAGRRSVLFGLASDGVYICPARCRAGGGLLHRLCTLTGLPAGGCFLLHFPGSRLHRTLSGILPCEARTFLTCSLSSLQPRPSVPLRRVPYHNSFVSASTWFFTRCSAVICDAQLHESSNRILSFLDRTASAELAPGLFTVVKISGSDSPQMH